MAFVFFAYQGKTATMESGYREEEIVSFEFTVFSSLTKLFLLSLNFVIVFLFVNFSFETVHCWLG